MQRAIYAACHLRTDEQTYDQRDAQWTANGLADMGVLVLVSIFELSTPHVMNLLLQVFVHSRLVVIFPNIEAAFFSRRRK